ncbi:hypothetical protein CRE_13684 [Caenorhabditis remanei]|uniref:CCHC-type domain-containing protein n=1 Tax=Caenorhabditis remanei TaxID=31234 RepID=E3N7J6_CAERE|nr:hypothetical protein CRE_13684 [Caenorhabditis remanei]
MGDGMDDDLERSMASGDDKVSMGAVQMSLAERRKRTVGFANFLATVGQVEEEVQQMLKTMTVVSSRQIDVVQGPWRKFRKELTERFKELDEDKWPRAVMRIMRESGLESLGELKNKCEKTEGGGEGNVGNLGEEKWLEEIEGIKNENRLLQVAWNEEREGMARRIQELEMEKEQVMQKAKRLEKLVKEEKRAAESMKSNLQFVQGKTSEKLSERNVNLQERWRNVDRRSSSSSSTSRYWDLERPKGKMPHVENGEAWEDKVKQWASEGRGSAGMKENGWERESVKAGNQAMESEVQGMVQCMSRMMKASALPEPKMFDGKGDFKEFKRAFLLKYNQVTDTDDELVAILEEKFLGGAAKSLFKALPNRYERSIRSLFEEFEMKLRKRQGDSKAEALNEFEGLRKHPNQKMWEYLVEVEKWSKKAFAEAGAVTLSQLRTTKLMMAARRDDTLHKMLVMKRLELPLEDQYEHLKDIVLQQENEKRRDYGWRRGPVGGYKEREGGNEKDRGDSSRIGGKEDEGGRRKEGFKIKCFKCGGIGHMSRQCTSKPVQEVAMKKVVGDTEKTVVGAEAAEVVEVLGQKKRMVINSGAVVSVVSKSAWEALKAGCQQWESEVEMLGKPDFTIVNASKGSMPVCEQIRLPIVVRGRRAVVVFQVVENEAEVFLLGTNAFESIGVELKWKAERAVARAAEKLRVPPQSCAQILLKTEVDLGEQVLLESKEECVPTSLCAKNENGCLTVVVSNWKDEPLLIKKNQVMGVVVREWKLQNSGEYKEVNMMDLDRKMGLKGNARVEEVLGILKENGEIPEGMIPKILQEYSDVFAVEESELTQTDMAKCGIELQEEKLIRQKCRPVPLALHDKLKAMLKDLEQRRVIKKCRSPWASPVVLVKKKDGSIRMCVDYRKLNAVIKLNAHPLPHIESTLQALGRKKWFTTLDLMAGYWQIPMEEESKEKTAFTVLNEQYQFEVMPFGLATSPAIFQEAMEQHPG